MLRNSACLAVGDLRLSNRIKQRSLAMVDVTHDGNDRRPCLQVLTDLGVGVGRRCGFGRRRIEEALLLKTDVARFESHLCRNFLDGLEIDSLIHRNHDSVRHQFALNRGRLQAGLLRKLANADVARHFHVSRLAGLDGGGRWLRRELVASPRARIDG